MRFLIKPITTYQVVGYTTRLGAIFTTNNCIFEYKNVLTLYYIFAVIVVPYRVKTL